MAENTTPGATPNAAPNNGSGGNTNNGGGRPGGGGSNNNNNNNNNTALNLPTIDKDFEGLIPEIKAVMGMFFEKKLKHRKSYTMFKQAILLYAEAKQFKHCKYLHNLLSHYVSGMDEQAKNEPRLRDQDTAE